MKRLHFSLLCLIFSTGGLFAAEPTARLRTSLDPSEIYIGDRVRYQIDVEYAPEMEPLKIYFSTFQPTLDVLGMESKPPENVGGKLNQTHVVWLTSFSTGPLQVPSLILPFKMNDDSRVEAKTQPVEIQVKSILEEWGDKGGLAAVKGFFNFKSYFWLWVVIGALLAGALIGWALHYRKKKRLSDPAYKKPSRPPEEIFWEAIQLCEDEGWVKPEAARNFYSSLSTALKGYLEGRFGIDALDRTTSELMGEIKKIQLEPPLPSHLKRFLETGDLVKFAKLTPHESEMEGDFLRLKEFASKTSPAESKKEEKPEELPV